MFDDEYHVVRVWFLQHDTLTGDISVRGRRSYGFGLWPEAKFEAIRKFEDMMKKLKEDGIEGYTDVESVVVGVDLLQTVQV